MATPGEDRSPREIRIRIPRIPNRKYMLPVLLVLAVGLGVGVGVIITQSGRSSPTSGTLEGDWTLSRTVTSCENLDGGCRADPMVLRFDNCNDTTCIVTRSNSTGWPDHQEIRREAPDSYVWVARFEQPAVRCRKNLNPAATELRVIVTDTDTTSSPATATAVDGTFSYGAASNPPDCPANPKAAYKLSGTRNAPDQVQSPTASDPKAVQAWYSGGGQKVKDDVAHALNNVFQVAKSKPAVADYPALRAACTALRDAAEAAQTYPTIPDPETQSLWSTELVQAARSSTECLAAAATDYSAGERVGAAAAASTREHNHLTDRLKALGVN